MSVSTAQKPLSDEAADVLRSATSTATTVTLPPGQLDRQVYVEVDKVLTRIGGGGKWNRRARVHQFPADPRPELEQLLDAGRMPIDQDKAMGYFRTPVGTARVIATALRDNLTAGPGPQPLLRVLEPSAGDGALVDAVLRVITNVYIDAIEPDLGRHADLWAGTKGQPVEAHPTTLEEFTANRWTGDPYDGIVMNPPFALPGQPRAGIEHVLAAWDLLAPGGCLVAILPDALASRGHRLVRQLGELIDAHGEVEALPDDTFRASGTRVRTCLVTLRRPR